MSQKSDSRDLDKVIVRLPEGMREKLKAFAEENNRSMNAEIVARLLSSMRTPEEEFEARAMPILQELLDDVQKLKDAALAKPSKKRS